MTIRTKRDISLTQGIFPKDLETVDAKLNIVTFDRDGFNSASIYYYAVLLVSTEARANVNFLPGL